MGKTDIPPLSERTKKAGGFELYVPPTPFPEVGKPRRFVMLDDVNQKFYDVFYDNPRLNNPHTWESLEFHRTTDPAIIISPKQLEYLNADPEQLKEKDQGYPLATGHLVSIISRGDMYVAELLGAVNVVPLPEKVMNWAALATWKGNEIVTELKNGLLRHVWNRRVDRPTETFNFSTPAAVLNAMSRPWHDDGTGAYVSYELDQIFMAASVIRPDQMWELIPQGWDSMKPN